MGRAYLSFHHLGSYLLITFLCLASVFVYGCFDGNEGVFTDSPVSGLSYSTQTLSGTTDAQGRFHYKCGETVTFSLGPVVLGSAKGASQLSPVNLIESGTTDHQAVINMARLLQSLDKDGNNNNGIQISEATVDVIETLQPTMIFDQATDDFSADPSLTTLFSELNAAHVFSDLDTCERTLRDASKAKSHLEASLSDRVVVQTNYGKLKGYGPTADTWQWVGVPYAKPPVGDLRWRAPQPPEAWTGIREATQWGDQAPQTPSYAAYANGGMSEDCLYLNITAPRDAENLPVMVWFHGGGFVILTGNAPSYNNPASLPGKDLVLVTVNHRLGPFGFLAHPWLTAEATEEGTGNFGQLDLIAALTWIRDNIDAFGGDPGNVTIFGESGGGGKSISLMASPLAANLFDKVICESGTAESAMVVLNGLPLDDAEAAGSDLVSRLGATSLAELRQIPWLDIINAENDAYNGDYKDVYGPVIDGHYMTDSLPNLIQAGLVSDVPFIAGVNSGDMPGLPKGMAEQMPWRSDNNNADQYAYIFTHVPEVWAEQGVTAYHGIELVYVFNYPGSFYSHYIFGLTGLTVDWTKAPAAVISESGYGSADLALTDTMMTMWANFAYTGDPSIPGTVQWDSYTTAENNYLEISASSQIMKDGLDTQLDVIDP